MNADRRETAYDLLAERATMGLGDREARELEALLGEMPGIDPDGYDLAAAALDLALFEPRETMPASVRGRIEADLLARAARVSAYAADPRSHVSPEPSPAPGRIIDFPTRREPARAPRLAWILAAAAAVLAVLGWWPRLGGGSGTPAPDAVQGPAELRNELIANAPDLLRKSWTVTEDPAAVGAQGDVVWSDARNEGYMRITGLETNDPRAFQYQLWVFDRARDDRYPVDGGVFDAPAGGETIIPIDPKVHVNEAVLFAITVEKPGGVVVSGRERIVLLAQKG